MRIRFVLQRSEGGRIEREQVIFTESLPLIEALKQSEDYEQVLKALKKFANEFREKTPRKEEWVDAERDFSALLKQKTRNMKKAFGAR